MWRNNKPRFLRLLRRYYKLCHVPTMWTNDFLILPGRVFFRQQIIGGIYYIDIVEIETQISYSFPVNKFSDVLAGIQRYKPQLIYKIKTKSKS